MRLNIYELKSIRRLLVQDQALPHLLQPPPRLGLGEGSLKYCLTEISWNNKNTINNEFPRWSRFEKNSACPTIKSQGWSHWGGCSFPQRATPPRPPSPKAPGKHPPAKVRTGSEGDSVDVDQSRDLEGGSQSQGGSQHRLSKSRLLASPACSLKWIFLSYLTQRRAFK